MNQTKNKLNSYNIDEGNYWKDMLIHKDSETPNRNIISEEAPIDFDKKNYETELEWNSYYPFTEKLSQEFGQEIVDFMNNHNVMYNGITERFTQSLVDSLASLKCIVFILRFRKTNKIMAFMADLPLYANTHESQHNLTTFLCVHKGLRGKGVCMLMIRKALKFAHDRGMLPSYYLVPKTFSKSALPIKRWMRPINYKSALQKGFEFETHKGRSDRTDIKSRMAFAVRKLPDDVICKQIKPKSKLYDKTFNWITKFASNDENKMNFMWKPQNLERWKRWCDAFPTFFVTCDGTNGGIISVQCKEILIPDTGAIAKVAFIPFHMAENSSPKLVDYMLKCALNYANEQEQDVLFCLQVGHLTPDILETNRAVRTTGYMYLDFYNFVFEDLRPNQIYVPLL